MTIEDHIAKMKRSLAQRALELPEAYTDAGYAEFRAIQKGYAEINELERKFIKTPKREQDEEYPLY